MQYKTLLFFTLLFTQLSFAQTNDVWVRFTDPKTALVGYKDLKGNIKIPAKFDGINRADTFYNIIAIHDSIYGHYQWYYLLKNGKRVGIDSVPTIELIPECESEGKILFRDKKTDRVGFFDKNGFPVIPAIYNYASSFFNGVAVARINAVRRCLQCEHPGWRGGEGVLINSKNEILIDSLDRSKIEDINWYSMRVNDVSVDTNIYVNFKGRYGNIYSFIDYKKEFTQWFENKFQDGIRSGSDSKLERSCLPAVNYWSNKYNKWITQSSKSFIKSFPPSFFKKRFAKDSLKQISIYSDDLDYLFSGSKMFNTFYNACGAYFKEKFPAFGVLITYYKRREPQSQAIHQSPNGYNANSNISEFEKNYEIDYQEHAAFLRTYTGYKLISVSAKNTGQ